MPMASCYQTFASYSNRSWLIFHLCLCITLCNHIVVAQQKLTFYVDENEPSGTVVGLIPKNGGTLLPLNSVPSELSLNVNTGVITTTRPLDREKKAEVNFQVYLILLNSQSTIYKINVLVNDLNDNSPRFEKRIYFKTFYEGVSSVDLDFKAVDPDRGINSTQKYSIISGNIDHVFNLKSFVGSDKLVYGKLILNGSLDREKLDRYLLNVSAKDGGIPARFDYALLNITVGDSNDNAPVFTSADYQGFILENATQGTSIVTVSATDADIGSNAKIEYEIDRGSYSDPDRIFSVDAKTGLVTNNLNLDYEKQREYRIVVIAKNIVPGSSQTANARLTIKVRDLNDNKPAIKINYALGGSYQVLEGAPIGTIVARIDVTDADSGANGQVNISLQDTHGYFTLQPILNDGYAIKVAKLIDRETFDFFTAKLVATDRGRPPKTTVEPFKINVGDVNDNAPKFDSSVYRGFVSEDSMKGKLVITVHASDNDTGTNAELVYSIVNLVQNSVFKDWFNISSTNGEIRTSGNLDRENMSQAVLTVTVTDRGLPPQTDNCTVIIDIRDANDNDPYFNQSLYFVSVTENSPNGSYVGQVFASDRDVGLNSIITYSIVANENEAALFVIANGSGVIKTAGQLDHEQRTSYLFTVVATDGGGRNTTAEVNVTVIDENDNSPVFSPEFYNLSYPENLKTGFILVNVTASDKDSGEFAKLHYEIKSGDSGSLFLIDHTTGAIKLEKSLDRETKDFYSLIISARDGGGQASTNFATVNFTVTDVNDEPPIFSKQKYNFSIVENSEAPSILGFVHATSKDIGSNAEIFYSIKEGNVGDIFAINKSGVIRVKAPIDHEIMQTFTLKVEAKDGGIPPLYGFVNVTVSVIDVNDNTPDFNTSQISVPIPENTKIGEPFYTLLAFDPDSGENGRVTYKLLLNPNSTFQLDSDTGKLSLNRTVSYSGVRQYLARVFAEDNGNPSRNTTVVLNLLIVDVNDHSPVFKNASYSIAVNEATVANSNIIQVRATDKDTGTNALITYSLHSRPNSVSLHFAIKSDGTVFLRTKLDRETKDIYYLKITASDHGVPIRTAGADLTVYVTDDNDNSPQFNQSGYTFSITENQDNGTLVGRLHATDLDIGTNALLKYKFDSPVAAFVLNSITGEIRTAEKLDREKKSIYNLMAVVSDSSSSPRVDKARVIVLVKDLNDNQPIFDRGSYRASIPENIQVGMSVVTISASDPDDGLNGQVTYSIIAGDEHSLFKINSRSGIIKTAAALDREKKDLYILSVEARDSGIPHKSGVRMVYVNILDVNDNHPVFTTNNTKPVYLDEKVPPGKYVTTVIATDDDANLNGQVSYSIVSGNIGDTFMINRTSGAIYTTKPLDYERRSRYQLEVQATDSSQVNPLHSTVYVMVFVHDSNDNSPTFQENPMFSHLEEGVPINTTVTTIKAQDADSKGPNSNIWYQIESQSPGVAHFQIDQKTGVVSTIAEIDRESIDEFSLIIRATDLAPIEQDRLSSTATLIILITDKNDNKPKFKSPSYTYVNEDEPVQYPVMTITAVDDDDAGSNSVVEYGMASRQNELLFHLDRYTGELKLIGQLDHEKQQKYVLNITAKDNGTPVLMSYQLFTINVVDVNDNRPVFNRTLYVGSVAENEKPGSFVIRVEATDKDSGTNADLKYSILQGADKDKFLINENSGVITTNTTLDHEGKKTYELKVYAQDSAFPFGVDRTEVRIKVLDKNDNPPKFTPSVLVVRVAENQPPTSFHTMTVEDADDTANKRNQFSIIKGNGEEIFAIGKYTGVLSTRVSLDRENVSSYELVVQAKNVRPPHYIATANVTVLVEDTNDNKPSFLTNNGSYNVFVKELTPSGSNILNVTAFDSDAGINGKVKYSLSTEAVGVFRIDAETGQIFTVQQFDYKKKNHYKFMCIATDQGSTPNDGYAQVVVKIKDQNNHSPVFKQFPYRQQASSGIASDKFVLQVSATDGDAGTNAEITYSLSVSSDEFRLESASGNIYTKIQPANGRYILHVQATDKGVPPLKGSGFVEIIVGNISGIPIRFVNASPSAVAIPENSAKGFEIARVLAVGDSVSYSIVSGNHGDTFSIDLATGVVSVEVPSKLDYESSVQFELYLAATSTTSSSLIAYLKLLISLLDVNDNRPTFHPTSLSIHLLEDDGMLSLPFHSRIVTDVNATDADKGSNAKIEYSIVSGNTGNKFEIDPASGLIRTRAFLDREQQSVYQLIVKASNPGSPDMSQRSLVRITLVDVNDNKPRYVGQTLVSVPENANIGTVITQLNVTDKDESPVLTYSLKVGSEQGPFAVGKFSGEIFLTKSLDYETKKFYSLKIIANDSLYAVEKIVNVSVRDVNDQSPVFEKNYYTRSVRENLPAGKSILKVSATDGDSGTNGQIKYAIYKFPNSSMGLNYFVIDEETGVISTSKPISTYNVVQIALLVVATDGGRPSKFALARVYFIIQKSIQFSQSSYQGSVVEDAGIGTSVLSLSVTSTNAKTISRVSYAIRSGGSVPFMVTPRSGLIKVNGHLDFETKRNYTFYVEASVDTESAPPARVDVYVKDVNDNVPKFSKGYYSITVPENIPVGTSLFQINATDKDSGQNGRIRFRIQSGDVKKSFHLDEKTGLLTTAKSLDHDTLNRHNLAIEARDQGHPEKVAVVSARIEVTDLNDNRPRFTIPDELTVDEEGKVRSAVGYVTATDRDSGSNAKVTYSIVGGSGEGLFIIDKYTGQLVTNASFNYEKKTNYTLIIKAIDKGIKPLSNNVTVTVLIGSVDEFDPQFRKRDYEFEVSADAKVGETVGEVYAVDKDSGPDGVVYYSLDKPKTDEFAVNRSSGHIYVNRTLGEANEVRSKRSIEEDKITGTRHRSRRSTVSTVSLRVQADSGKENSRKDVAYVKLTVIYKPPVTKEPRFSDQAKSLIVGLACLAGVLVLVIVILAIIFKKKRRKKNRRDPPLRFDGSFDEITVLPAPPNGTANYAHIGQSEEDLPRPRALPDEFTPLNRRGDSSSSPSNASSETPRSASSGRGSEGDGEFGGSQVVLVGDKTSVYSDKLNGKGSFVPDSGIQPDDDQISQLTVSDGSGIFSTNVDGFASESKSDRTDKTDRFMRGLESHESLHVFGDEGGGEADGGMDVGNLLYAKLAEVDADEDDSIMDGTHPYVEEGGTRHSYGGSLSSIVGSQEELSGSYNWDYLLNWGPQFQPLADVFLEIGRMKDEVHFHPDILSSDTNHRQPEGIRTTDMLSSVSSLPRTPISHPSTSYSSPALSPNFTPAITPLVTRSPSISPLDTPSPVLSPQSATPVSHSRPSSTHIVHLRRDSVDGSELTHSPSISDNESNLEIDV